MPKRGVTTRSAASTVASGMRPCAAGGLPSVLISVLAWRMPRTSPSPKGTV